LSSLMAIHGLANQHRRKSKFYGVLCAIVFAVALVWGAVQHRDSRLTAETLLQIGGSRSYFVAEAILASAGPRFDLVVRNVDVYPIYDASLTIAVVPPSKLWKESPQEAAQQEYRSLHSLNIGTINAESVAIYPLAISNGAYFISINTRFATFTELLAIGDDNGHPAQKYRIIDHGGKVVFHSPIPASFSCPNCPDWNWQ